MNWHVVEIYTLSCPNRVIARLEKPGEHPVQMSWDGARRIYTFYGTKLLVSRKDRRVLESALAEYFLNLKKQTNEYETSNYEPERDHHQP